MTHSQPVAGRTKRFLANLGVRFYALILLALVAWAATAALSYLFRSVFEPNKIPDRFVNRPLALPVDVLEQGGQAVAAGHTAPLNHYHGVGRLAWGAAQTGCTTSGCHSPLPHEKDKATRAFANLHVTFMDCHMCHDASLSMPIETAWYDATTGETFGGSPPLLAIAALFESARDEKPTDKWNAELLRLLGLAVAARPDDARLAAQFTELETSQPGSPAHRMAIANLRRDLPNHARGEYGALLGSAVARQRTTGEASQRSRWTREYLAPGASDAERREIHDSIHADILPKPNACLECHSDPALRMDFSAAGYPPRRAAQLQSLSIARLVQRIREGSPFYLPEILEPGDER